MRAVKLREKNAKHDDDRGSVKNVKRRVREGKRLQERTLKFCLQYKILRSVNDEAEF
jgi:hypothetical protein